MICPKCGVDPDQVTSGQCMCPRYWQVGSSGQLETFVPIETSAHDPLARLRERLESAESDSLSACLGQSLTSTAGAGMQHYCG